MKKIILIGALALSWGARLLAEESVAGAGATQERTWVSGRLSVCVYCGASDTANPKYAAVARQVGEAIARRRWTLVWGGARSGLMGAVASGARNAGGRTVGVIPDFILRWGVADNAADELMTVTTMHERKQLLQTRADVFVILPGGIGTLDEIADTLDLRNLSQHRKPILLLNQDGYYDALIAWLDRSVSEQFSKPEAMKHLRIVDTVDGLLGELNQLAARRE